MEPRPLATPTQIFRRSVLHRLKNRIARARAKVQRHQLALSALPPERRAVAQARLAAVEHRLDQLLADRQRLRDEFQKGLQLQRAWLFGRKAKRPPGG